MPWALFAYAARDLVLTTALGSRFRVFGISVWDLWYGGLGFGFGGFGSLGV